MPKKDKPIKVIHRKLGREKAMGQAWHDYRLIEIDIRVTGKDYIDTVIHEILHLQNPDWSERKVKLSANEITQVLWDLGIRTVEVS